MLHKEPQRQERVEQNAPLTLPLRDAMFEQSSWDWGKINALLNNDPRHSDLMMKAMSAPSRERAMDLARAFESVGAQGAAEVCRNLKDSYASHTLSVTPAKYIAVLDAAPEAVCELGSECPEVSEEAMAAERERLYLDRNTLAHWSWGSVLYFGRGSVITENLESVLLCGHTEKINGAICVAEAMSPQGTDCFLSWSDDKTLRLWKVGGGVGESPPAIPNNHPYKAFLDAMHVSDVLVSSQLLQGHSGAVLGAFPMPDGRVVSWGEDCTLRVWRQQPNGTFSHETLLGHTAPPERVQLGRDGRIYSWNRSELIVWE